MIPLTCLNIISINENYCKMLNRDLSETYLFVSILWKVFCVCK